MSILNNVIEPERITDNGDIIQGASYTCKVLNHKVRTKIIIKAVCDLRPLKDEFDSIACCGSSGLMVVPQIAELLNKNIILIRKKDEKCYSNFAIEGVRPFRYIIIDDLICSGNTIRHITRTIRDEYSKTQCVGLYCYMPDECAYNKTNLDRFQKDFGLPFLNPFSARS